MKQLVLILLVCSMPAFVLHAAEKRGDKLDQQVLIMRGERPVVGQRYYFIPHEYQPGANSQGQDIRKQGLGPAYQ